MGRSVNLSPLGLYQWDNTVFDLMQIPSALDKNTLVDNLLAETAELEVLYPNPVVFKNLVGVWSAKNIDVWNKLYATTQYEYNPIENYDRYETGTSDGSGSTTHSGTDATTESTMFGGIDGRTESTMHGGSDSVTRQLATGGTDTTTTQKAEGGTQGEQTTGQIAMGGTDSVTGADTKGHWIAGFDSSPSGTDDGLVKQTRDQDDATTTTQYGKTEANSGSSTTSFGKTESGSDAIAYGRTESGSDTTQYGKTESITEQKTYGQTISKTGGLTHGEQIRTSEEGSHELHAHGNIGVTTTQQMIEQERRIDLFNLYDIIIEDFKMRFCILIY